MKLIDKLFGRRYYANIINTVGTDRFELCCGIFRTKADAEAHKATLATTASFRHVETVTFRSRKNY